MNKNYENFSDHDKEFFDSFGNRTHNYEIARYEKHSDGTWEETGRRETVGTDTFVMNGKIYFRYNDSLIPMNMDFDSKTCGVCERIEKEIPVGRKIVGNSVLAQFNYVREQYSLCRQDYSDGTSFYTLQDSRGQWNVRHGNNELKPLIKSLDGFFKDEEIKNQLSVFA